MASLVAAQQRRDATPTPRFRAFRNYDGAGGDLRRHVGVGDVERRRHGRRSTPASTRPTRTSVVIVAINKATTAKTAGDQVITLQRRAHEGEGVHASPRRGGPNVVAQPDITTAATNAFRYTMPAHVGLDHRPRVTRRPVARLTHLEF